MLYSMIMDKPSYLNFDKETYAWKPDVDYRAHPGLYRIGKGEQGVLICEPYQSETGKYWRFKTPEIAEESSTIIYAKFEGYLSKNDFVGADRPENICKWVTQGQGGMPTIRVAKSMMRKIITGN